MKKLLSLFVAVSVSTSFAVPIGGELILKFTDNSLTTSGDAAPDLHIFEIGGAVEWMNISISKDMVTWINLGDLKGQPTSINIDGVAGVVAYDKYSYVRIRDVLGASLSGYPYGEADIDAVGAISSAAPVATPEPATMLSILVGLFSLAGLKLRRKN